jgi:hypothetical protein
MNPSWVHSGSNVSTKWLLILHFFPDMTIRRTDFSPGGFQWFVVTEIVSLYFSIPCAVNLFSKNGV